MWEAFFSWSLKLIQRTLGLGSNPHLATPEADQPEWKSSCLAMISAFGWLLSPCMSRLLVTSCASLPMDFDKSQYGRPWWSSVGCGMAWCIRAWSLESGRPGFKSIFCHYYLWPWTIPLTSLRHFFLIVLRHLREEDTCIIGLQHLAQWLLLALNK